MLNLKNDSVALFILGYIPVLGMGTGVGTRGQGWYRGVRVIPGCD